MHSNFGGCSNKVAAMSATATDTEVRRLLEAAERAGAAGHKEDAEKFLTQAQSLAPEHALVLSTTGMRAFAAGDARTARQLLERAVAQESQTPMLWLNLALTCRASKDPAAEKRALNAALKLDPYFFLALLQKATLLERQGDPKRAAGMYHAFLCCVPTTQLPAALQSAVEHARRAVQANKAALANFLSERTRASREAYADARLNRFDACMDVMTGGKRVYVQQPTFMHFPGLPAIEFYDRDEFPWLDAVEAATDDIRQELLQLFNDAAEGFVPYVANPDGTPLNQWKELNHSPNWSAFYLWREGAAVTDHLARCPKTAAILAGAPRADVPGHAPTAFFSILKPKTRIPPHTGVTNTRLVVHLPLIVPAGCGFRVGSQTHEWVPGRAWVFDDTIEHEAWNDSDEVRAVLIFDIWNPYLTAAERDLVRVSTAAISEYYGGESPLAGGL